MNKKIFILIIAVLVLIFGGFFYYWQFYETPPEKWDEAEYSKPEDYLVVETPEGIIVENKKAGLSFRVPEGWRVERPEYGNYIAIYSPNAIGRAREGRIENGCEVIIEIMNIKTSIKTLEKRLKELHKKWEYPEEYEIVVMKGHKGLKNVTGIPAFNLYGIGVHLPIKELFGKSRLYYLSISSDLENKEQCAQEFEQFLKTISIK